ncbi:hypothetical protein DPMN_068801 [Dreissena polymorpha]|uniref:Uncharacterized protein n=1 Tax=Dreissena polymorpha TaxID=45954 RepID=A0A9D4BUG7_DREPO|nr:hypothetical protein DPMN_068801 [Dreissena polymorpha]
MEDNAGGFEKDDEGFADCDSPDDETMETNLAAEGEGKFDSSTRSLMPLTAKVAKPMLGAWTD